MISNMAGSVGSLKLSADRVMPLVWIRRMVISWLA
jgi:hypothetical protein